MSLNELAKDINKISRDHGFWDNPRNFGEMIALAHSELSEALEEYRDNNPPLWYKHEDSCDINYSVISKLYTDLTVCNCSRKPEGTAVELADCIIRCLDTMSSLDIDIDAIITEKINYNRNRPHKHGKAF